MVVVWEYNNCCINTATKNVLPDDGPVRPEKSRILMLLKYSCA
jgi:hypothetical protein